MNRLSKESSPYLLQHAHNPVDWYAWKPEAFERARREQIPILVSIGYSTCHWCHVMERESFEHDDVAAFMNEFFVNIKVDREERPDVDAIYMEACQILTGGGGWPLNVFLTPEGKPFYAGTYFPPRPAHGRPSWLQVLQHMVGVWQQKREVVYEQADKLLGHIQRNDNVFVKTDMSEGLSLSSPTSPVFDHPALYKQMRERFDRADGGFGGAPKFPSTMALHYLLNYHHFTGDPEALEHALFSLQKMISGGIYDQLGGGFARYATDREWLVPHFEKMLYDNALLVTVMSEAHKLVAATGADSTATLLRETIEETLGYVAREMTHPEGGFYAAQDADSEGVEGKFFVWDKSEIDAILGDEADLFCRFYGVTEAGNWEEKNILWRETTYEAFAENNGMPVAALRQQLTASRQRLFERRSKRIWPGLDDKILLSWNALMASAYTHAFTALGQEAHRQAAVKNIDFLLDKFVVTDPTNGQTQLKHNWKNGHAAYDAFLEDYAFLIAALVDVYQITFDFRYLEQAAKYMEHVLSYFQDVESGLFFFTDVRQSDIVLRKKEVYDNATPSGNSTMVLNLQRLGLLLDRRDWRETAHRMLMAMRETVERYPLSFERWALAMMFETWPPDEIAVVGTNAYEKAISLQRRFWPNKVVAASSAPNNQIPLLANKTGNPDAYIYVCRDFTCRQPVLAL